MTRINVAEQRLKNDRRKLQDASGHIIKIRGATALKVNGEYYADTGNKLSIKFDIVEDGTKRIDIDSIVLKVPLIKIFNGQPVDEMFLDARILQGDFAITGKFTTPGRWVLDFDAVNESLKGIGSDWKLTGENITFLV